MRQLTQQQTTTTFFRLNNSLSYNTMGIAEPKKYYQFRGDTPIAVSNINDIDLFRGRTQLLVECDANGVPLATLRDMRNGVSPVAKRAITYKKYAKGPLFLEQEIAKKHEREAYVKALQQRHNIQNAIALKEDEKAGAKKEQENFVDAVLNAPDITVTHAKPKQVKNTRKNVGKKEYFCRYTGKVYKSRLGRGSSESRARALALKNGEFDRVAKIEAQIDAESTNKKYRERTRKKIDVQIEAAKKLYEAEK